MVATQMETTLLETLYPKQKGSLPLGKSIVR